MLFHAPTTVSACLSVIDPTIKRIIVIGGNNNLSADIPYYILGQSSYGGNLS